MRQDPLFDRCQTFIIIYRKVELQYTFASKLGEHEVLLRKFSCFCETERFAFFLFVVGVPTMATRIDWRKCPGRTVLLEDLNQGTLSLDEIETLPEEAWEMYKDRPEFDDVPFSQFKRQLKAHRDQVRKKQRRIVNSDNDAIALNGDDQRDVAWLHCAAREILLEDLRNGLLSVDEEETSVEEAWNYYRHFEEFLIVPFTQFKRQLKAHREQVTKLVEIAMPQELALMRDRELYPVQKVGRNGVPHFYLTEAAALLRDDVQKDLHAGLTPSAFRATRKEYSFEFCGLTLEKFKQRIYQEIRYRKYCNYLEITRGGKLQ